MAESRERALRFESKMSDAEALMWNIEKDPWLNPSGAIVTILEGPVDPERLRRRMVDAVANVPRLRERVAPGFGRLAPPTWVPDPEFDLDYHLRHVSLPAPGTERQLYDLVTRLYEDPYDRTRPLWQFVVIDGLEGGRGALFTKMHHSISDGIGAIRLAERYMELEPDAPLPDEIDLDKVVAEAVAAAGDLDDSPLDNVRSSFGHLIRRQLGVTQRAIGEAAMWTADPMRMQEVVKEAADTVGTILGQVGQSEEGPNAGSPLWTERSRHRHLESVRLPLEDMKAAGKALGASVNDVFVAGAVAGAVAYHEKRNAPVEALNISFVVSTREDSAVGGNSFVPTPLTVPGTEMTAEERVNDTRDRMAEKRDRVSGDGALAGLAGVANLLPTSVVTQAARARAAKMDFATSNLRAAPFAVYIGGAKATDTICLGPVAGTACNMTMMSYDGNLFIGILSDPAAIEDPADLAACLAEAYADLAAAGGVVVDADADSADAAATADKRKGTR